MLGILAVSLAMTGLVYAAGDDQSTENNTTMSIHRSMVIEENPQSIFIRSNVETGSIENHIGILFNTAHGIAIQVAFSHENEVTDMENSSSLHLRVAYVRLVEFNDTDHNGGLDSADKLVQWVSLQNLTYTMPSWKPVLSQDNKRGVEITSNATVASGPHTGLFFGVVADIFPEYALVNGQLVPPTATKITTTINNFPFKDSADRLALQVSAVSATQIEQETPTTEQTIRVRSATAQGFYTWAPTAKINGVNQPVVSSFTKTKAGSWLIDLAYPSGSSIVHDPILGFDLSAPTPIIDASLLIGAAIASVAVCAVLAYMGRPQLGRAWTTTTKLLSL